MSDDVSPLNWTPQQWAMLRSVIQESARKSRVASRFLPLEGPVARDQTTVPAYKLTSEPLAEQGGKAGLRLETSSGDTLQLTTIACNVYLRGSEVADPELHAAKSMVSRAAEILGRVEDSIVFNGLEKKGELKRPVYPTIYTITSRPDEEAIGLLGAPDKAAKIIQPAEEEQAPDQDLGSSPAGVETDDGPLTVRGMTIEFQSARVDQSSAPSARKNDTAEVPATEGEPAQATRRGQTDAENQAGVKVDAKWDELFKKVAEFVRTIRVEPARILIVEAVNRAVQILEEHGHFGPFVAVFGHQLFQDATTPRGTAATLPMNQFLPFLGGGELYRSSTLPDGEGLIIAVGGRPIELVLGTDMDIKYVQTTLEPRHVLRISERLALRIKEFDAVCKLTMTS